MIDPNLGLLLALVGACTSLLAAILVLRAALRVACVLHLAADVDDVSEDLTRLLGRTARHDRHLVDLNTQLARLGNRVMELEYRVGIEVGPGEGDLTVVDCDFEGEVSTSTGASDE